LSETEWQRQLSDQKADLDTPGSQCWAESHIPIRRLIRGWGGNMWES
jgi:hypothetical protein